MKTHFQLLAFVSLALMFAGCAHPRPRHAQFHREPAHSAVLSHVNLTNRIAPDWLQPPTELFTLGPGDRLEIELIGEPNSKITTIVAPDGKIYFSLLAGVDVWCLTLPQAKERLEQELAGYVKQKPPISLVLRGVESKRVWVLGRVQAPGLYAI